MERRYRFLRYGHSLGQGSGLRWSFGWISDRLPQLAPVRWRPDADTYETVSSVEIVVELAGIDEDAIEIGLFEDVLVVEGRRDLPAAQRAQYHVAGIRQGRFRVELPLPAPVDPEKTEARLERGLLLITLPKRAEAK